MTNYCSVVNTAKNGKLTRPELREYVLSIGLVYGFCFDPILGPRLYPDNENRQKQFTKIAISKTDIIGNKEVKMIDFDLPYYLIEVIKKVYKHFNDSNNLIIYDTKKFRIYRDRLQFGQDRKIRLNEIFQYLWTPALFTTLYSYRWIFVESGITYIRLNDFHFFRNAYDTEETISYIKRYLKEVCNLELSLKKSNVNAYYSIHDEYGPCIIFPEDYRVRESWDNLAQKTAEYIKNKLEKGKYI